MNKFEELLTKYNKTVEDITFEFEGMTDEELENAFADAFNEAVPEPATDEKFVKSFELSHSDIRYALYNLLASYEEADNDWYYITDVYDNHFCYENFDGDKIFGQSYTKDGDNVSLEGERYSLHKELLTDSEYAELQTMRSNYSSIQEKLSQYESAEVLSQKESIFEQPQYANYLETEEFTALKNDIEKYSVEELSEKAELAFAKCVQRLGFSLSESKEEVNKKPIGQTRLPVTAVKKKNRYGSLFSK